MPFSRRTWTEIDCNALLHNYETIHKQTAGCKIMAVVKADAYGHGDIAVAKVLQQAGVHWFAVSNFEEALSLREQGITCPILVLGYTPPENAAGLADRHITQTVYSLEYAYALNEAAQAAGTRINCHIKLDTGMARIGFCAWKGHEEIGAAQTAQACMLPGLDCTGIFTHFSCADELSPESTAFTREQFQSFQKTVALLEKQGFHFLLHHCCNSAATLRFPEMYLDMVRAGVILYGLSPAPECDGLANLHPVMNFYSTITLVKEVEAGIQVSYGRTYTAPEQRKLATIAVGYADGFRRNFSNLGHVIVHGQYAPIVGRVCMDQTLIDVTGIPDVTMGDRVILVGQEGNCSITFDQFAQLNGTINYEEICLIGRRVPRVYLKDGREFGITDYLLQPIEKIQAEFYP